jgi:hypothetical protein
MNKIVVITMLGAKLLVLFPVLALSDDVAIEDATAKYDQSTWTFHVTLRHEDSGWEHYADAWRVIGADDKIFGTRTLFHPHETEQPFTRSLSGISIPAKLKYIYIEAHDKVHGWNQEKFKLKLVK